MRIVKILALSLAGIVALIGLVVGGALGFRGAPATSQCRDTCHPHPEWHRPGHVCTDRWTAPMAADTRGGSGQPRAAVCARRAGRLHDSLYVSLDAPLGEVLHDRELGSARRRAHLLSERGGADQTATGMDQIINDGIQVAQFTRGLLHKDRIIVLGESFGSAVSLEMVRRRPDLFYADVGTGQIVDMPRGRRACLRWAAARGPCRTR